MAHYMVVAIDDKEDPHEVAEAIEEWLAYAGVVREVLTLELPGPLLDAVRTNFKPNFEDD